MQALLILLSVVVALDLSVTLDPSVTPLNEWPMLQAHDAATTYLKSGLINRWAKTQQNGGISGMLNCAARAFDWRPTLTKDRKLLMHHGPDVINHPMSSALDELVAWSMAQPQKNSPDDLVILGITDCTDSFSGGAACLEAVSNLLIEKNIKYVNSSCTALKGWSVQDAVDFGQPPKGHGAPIIATFGCWEENYDPSIACSGFGKKLEYSMLTEDEEGNEDNAIAYTCYNDSTTKVFPLNRMYAYLEKYTQIGPPDGGRLYSLQAIWQETASSVIVSGLHGSSLLLDEVKSNFNHLLADRIKNKQWNVSRVNFVEVNNVCDGGPALLKALKHAKAGST